MIRGALRRVWVFFLGVPPTLEGISQLPVDTPHVIQATGLQAAVDCFELASLLSGILSKTTVKLVSFSLGFSVFFFGWRSRVEISKVQQLWYRCIG